MKDKIKAIQEKSVQVGQRPDDRTAAVLAAIIEAQTAATKKKIVEGLDALEQE